MNKAQQSIIKGRKIVDKFRTDLTTMNKHGRKSNRVKLLQRITALEFESIDDLFQKSEAANWAELKRCYIGTGVCDFCEGRDPCITIRTSKHLDKHTDVCIPGHHWDVPWYVYYYYYKHENKVPEGCCLKWEQLHELEFDITWGMELGDSPEEVNQIKKKINK
jgi:hypothetical protein